MIHRDECAAQPYEMKLGRRIHVDTMSTPPPEIVHGVGADLKSYQRRIDQCALQRP